LNFVKTGNGKYSGSVFVEILFHKASDSTIVNFNKYALHMPETSDTNGIAFNLLDVQRYTLSKGNYFFELKIKDKNGNDKPFVYYESFSINFPDDRPSFSDIELIGDYSKSNDTSILVKNGYKLIPYIFSYFPQSVSTLDYYLEFYPGTTATDKYLIVFFIRPFEIDNKLEKYIHYKKIETNGVKVLLNSMDISTLPSGNYYLVVEARDQHNNLIASKRLFFQRSNPAASQEIYKTFFADAKNTFAGQITNRDTLVQYIKYLYPISTEMERVFAESQIKTADIAQLQNYFYGFWLKRDKIHPLLKWLKYKELVDQVNHDFTTTAYKGYETDRGRVYLQYGPPNVMTKSYHEPAAYPYEIWHYYKLDNQRNIKFVFYSKDLATNDFQLIHSNAIGELSNYQWQTFIYNRTWKYNNIDNTQPPDAWGNQASDYYYHPR
jgi:GWxTD domain-containing protein